MSLPIGIEDARDGLVGTTITRADDRNILELSRMPSPGCLRRVGGPWLEPFMRARVIPELGPRYFNDFQVAPQI